jgi:predicted P-loop ATPase
MGGIKLQKHNLLSNIGNLIGLRKSPRKQEIDIQLVADIAYETMLFAGPDASYQEVTGCLTQLIGDALSGKPLNEHLYIPLKPIEENPEREKQMELDIEAAIRCTYMPWKELSEEDREYAAFDDDALLEDNVPTTAKATKAETKESQTQPKETTPKEKPLKESMLSKLTKFLKVNYAFRYNVLTRESEMKHNEDEEYVVIGKREQNTIVLEAQEAGVTCWDKDVTRIIESTNTTTYHPFTEYFDNLPEWDGKDRVGELAKRVSEKELWVSSFHRWMLGVATQWMNFHSESTRANCVAPLLISTEQGWGKSTFCRMLLPKELRRYYTESFDLASQASCEKRLGNYGLINLDEFDKYSAKKMPILKNLMQEQALNVHLAYQKSDTTLHRIASFIGTSNRRDLLTDTTGSRRFICVELEKEIDCETPIEYSQLYAQLKAELIRGERTYFTKEEERQIQQNNRPYYQCNPESEAFHRNFRMAQRTDEGAEFMTASEIYTQLKRSEKAVMRGISVNKFARLLPELGQKVHTTLGNGYYVVSCSR